MAERERRAWVRLPSDREVSCRADTGGWLARIRDISQGGMALILRQKFDLGKGLFIDLATNAGEVRSLAAQVARVSLERESCWIKGCPTLGADELQTFVRA